MKTVYWEKEADGSVVQPVERILGREWLCYHILLQSADVPAV